MTLTDGHYVAISTYTAGNHLEKIVIDYQNYHATICFYAGKAPIGSFVNVCMKNNYKFTVNPELVNISSP